MSHLARLQKLKKMKALATTLLVAVTALLIYAKSHHDAGIWAWVSAFAEAAMVGALADWFAVVALFRRPLGLPIPHTAILPRNKARVADALAEFVRDKFLGTDALLAKLPAIDPAKRLATWTSEPANARLLADRVADASTEVLRFVDDERVKNVLYQALSRKLDSIDLGLIIGKLLDILTEGDRHQLLLNEGIRRMSEWLDKPEIQQIFADKIMLVAGTEYPKMVTALGFIGINPEELGLKLAVALVKGFNRWLHDIGDNPEHERRREFDATVATFITRLKSDVAFRQKIETAKRDLLAHPAARDYVSGIWDSLRARLEADLARPDSTLRARLADAIARFGQRIMTSPALCDSINAHFGEAIRSLAPSIRDTIATHIAETVRQWDDEAIANEVEASVGSDLQYIRINGTVVGGLVGVGIHAALLAAGAA